MNIINALRQPFGLGDLAYWVFRPFVYATDFVWGTDMRHCEVCKDRRARWNLLGFVPTYVPVACVIVLLAIIL